ncbi:hypothetical protein [Pinirhizobacter sp.]|jgi:hypothetical protein|uniref:hypothetical protein n=1 Tax=Pinirhizobacter sp. TaxID=2950432 RepID=UPI002F410CBC
MSRQRYYLSVDNLAAAKGREPSLAFEGIGPAALAAALTEAMRSDTLFERWKALQAEPDDVDPSLGVTDPSAQATGKETGRSEIELVTTLPMSIVRQRLTWLIGSSWQMRDIKAA